MQRGHLRKTTSDAFYSVTRHASRGKHFSNCGMKILAHIPYLARDGLILYLSRDRENAFPAIRKGERKLVLVQ